ncbi:hypothetical protein Tco_0287543 [Tanacetum coccineum]
MSQPANDVFSQHLSDDEASFHEDASDTKGGEIMGHEDGSITLKYDNDVWKVIQNVNSKKRISTGKDGVVRILPPVSTAEIHVVEKEMKARTILLMAIQGFLSIGTPQVPFSKSLKCSKKLLCFHTARGALTRECHPRGKWMERRRLFLSIRKELERKSKIRTVATMDMGVNWGEHTEEEVETNHALMAISSNNKVSLCSKTCIDSYNKLKTLCDEQTNQLGEQEVKILAYDQAVKKLEAQVVTFQKQQLSLNEQLTFQANELYEKDEKLKKYRRIGMKAIKEKKSSNTEEKVGKVKREEASKTRRKKERSEKAMKGKVIDKVSHKEDSETEKEVSEKAMNPSLWI